MKARHECEVCGRVYPAEANMSPCVSRKCNGKVMLVHDEPADDPVDALVKALYTTLAAPLTEQAHTLGELLAVHAEHQTGQPKQIHDVMVGHHIPRALTAILAGYYTQLNAMVQV